LYTAEFELLKKLIEENRAHGDSEKRRAIQTGQAF
jgi:hypothetical protein